MSGNSSKKDNRRNALPAWYAGLDHVWLPYTQMKTATPPVPVVATHGSTIVLADGSKLIDGVASWWTACHGYNHPHIRAEIERQLAVLPHVMFGGIVHEQPLKLAKRIAALLAPADLDRVFFSESGSVAVEVALKIAVQYWRNRGIRKRTRILSFKGSYHGDTIGAMAVSDPDANMHAAFRGLLPQQITADLPLDEASAAAFENLLARHADEVAAIIVEPLVQGAGGMRFHDAEVLRKLRAAADRCDALLIFDEIFTGFGRTGSMFAFQAAGVTPDILTLGKALTGGTLPLAATVARRKIFDAFWFDDPGAALMHGPTFMANALASAAANASLDLFEREPRIAQVERIARVLRRDLANCGNMPGVKDVRILGAIGVIELDRIGDLDALRQRFIRQGVFIRPFGEIVYLTPAFTIAEEELGKLTKAVNVVLGEMLLS
ncbi:MAG: adenosylmethionine--8-amino-7-oxononanoate transaminase [Xanthobacteraceae bacterium]